MELRIWQGVGIFLLCAWVSVASATLPGTSKHSPKQPLISHSQRFGVFAEALVPFGRSSAAQIRALRQAINAYQAAQDPARTQALDHFLSRYPHSAWRVALLTNEGLAEEHAGEFSQAIRRLRQAWDAGRAATGHQQQALAQRALGELLYLHTAFGHAQAVQKLLNEVQGRTLFGPASVDKTLAREGLWAMRHDPGHTYLCGLVALRALLRLGSNTQGIPRLTGVTAGPDGITLARLHQLSGKAGLRTRMVHRASREPIPVPSIVHWKVGHYATIVGHADGLFHIKDATLGHDLWMTREAVNSESSGYFLVPANAGKDHWRTIAANQAKHIVGAGITPGNNPDDTSNDDISVCGCGGHGGSGSSGMARYSVKAMLVSLSLRDTPVGYTPPKGPAVPVTLVYSQREANQPANFTFFNLGQKWTSNWLSYVTDDPAHPDSDVSIYLRGGGTRYYAGYNASSGKFAPEERTGAQLVEISTSPAVYERRLPDGSKQVYASPDGNTYAPRRVFLTRVVDPAGNSVSLGYDRQMRLTTLTDALGQKTTFQYNNPHYPLQITNVTDPFGRQATITYDASGRLARITDVMGMQSQFAYGDGTFIQSLTTPYGTTRFAGGQNGTERWLEITDPQGHKERVEYRHNAPGIPFSDNPVPRGIATFNSYINARNTYVWDQTAMQRAPGDYTQARIYHWLHEQGLKHDGLTSGVLESIKRPLEHRIWFNYPDQPWAGGTGGLDEPSAIARVLDDGSTRLRRFQYNRLGRVTRAIDPRGRQVDYTYAANAIDLLKVTRKTASSMAVLAQFTYNSRHEPLSYTDAAGHTTQYTYNGGGQLTRKTDAIGETTQYEYDGNGYLLRVIDPNGKTRHRYTYDGYGRLASRTDAEGHTVRYDYDALNRPTAVIYPDGTRRTITWNKLDPVSTTDRQGRTTTFAYDSVRGLVSRTDPMGEMTRFGYYANGNLRALTDANGNTTTWARDIEGRITGKTYADGTTDRTAYGAAGHLTSRTDARGQTTHYSYTAAGRLQGIDYPDAVHPTPAVHFSYGTYYPRLTSMSDGHGTTAYSYYPAGADGAGRLKARNGDNPHDTIHYRYDALGRPIRRSVDGAQERYTYDPLGRLSEDVNPLGDFTQSYLGETDQPTRMTIADVPYRVAYRYQDNFGDRRLKAILNDIISRHRPQPVADYRFTTRPDRLIVSRRTNGGTRGWNRDHHHDHGHHRGWWQGRHNGWHHAHQRGILAWLRDLFGHYRAEAREEGRHAQRRVWHGHRPIDDDAHDRGRHRGHQDHDHGWGHQHWHNGHGRSSLARFDYDNASRLTGVRSGPTHRRYTYDAAGNLVAIDNGNNLSAITVNAVNQIVSVGNKNYTYNANGDLVDDGRYTYQWDAANRLITIQNQQTGQISRFQYDGRSHRISDTETDSDGTTTTVRFLWCGQRLCEKRSDSGSVLARYYAQGEVHNDRSYYYAKDQVGSVVALVDARGRVAGRLSYDAYGHITHASGTLPDYRYAGLYYHPASGLELATYRAYDPATARWLSRDPIREAGGINLYRYARNDPINSIDFQGLWAIEFSAFDVGGASLAFGRNPDGSWFIATGVGFGVGGSLGFDPNATAPGWQCGKKGVYTTLWKKKQVGLDVFNFAVGGGTTQTKQLEAGNTSPEERNLGFQYNPETTEGVKGSAAISVGTAIIWDGR